MWRFFLTVAILIGLIFGQAPKGFSFGNQLDYFLDKKNNSKNNSKVELSSSDDSNSSTSSDEDGSDSAQLDGLRPSVANYLPPLHCHSKLLFVNSDFILSPLIRSLERPPKLV
ncbi:MAG: hypothetical protein ABI041_08250 [Bdellovibrionia bacterium]